MEGANDFTNIDAYSQVQFSRPNMITLFATLSCAANELVIGDDMYKLPLTLCCTPLLLRTIIHSLFSPKCGSTEV